MPGRAAWPAASLTPRNFGFESRPFFVDPPAFVCAIDAIFSTMTIADKLRLDKIPKSLLVILAILLSGAVGIGIGLLMARDGAGKGDQLWIEQLPAVEQAGIATSTPPVAQQAAKTAGSQTAAAAAALPSNGAVVASKTGNVYYLPSCSGAARIKPENKVTYATRFEAEAKGLTPSKTCKGL